MDSKTPVKSEPVKSQMETHNGRQYRRMSNEEAEGVMKTALKYMDAGIPLTNKQAQVIAQGSKKLILEYGQMRQDLVLLNDRFQLCLSFLQDMGASVEVTTNGETFRTCNCCGGPADKGSCTPDNCNGAAARAVINLATAP